MKAILINPEQLLGYRLSTVEKAANAAAMGTKVGGKPVEVIAAPGFDPVDAGLSATVLAAKIGAKTGSKGGGPIDQ